MKLDEACRRLRENDPTLTILYLDANQIDDDGAKALATALATNTTLKELNLDDNRIGDAGVGALATALAVNTTLKELYLMSNQIGDDGAKKLAKALATNSTLVALGLSGNQIGDAAAKVLATALVTNTTLQGLDLRYNQIGDAGAKALAMALATNATLKWLRLASNQIGDDGSRALLQMLQQHNGSLTGLNLDFNSGISDALKSKILALVEQNMNKTRNPPPRPKLTRVAAAQEEASRQEQFQMDRAEKFPTRAALDEEVRRLQDFIEAATGVTDPDVMAAAARAEAEYEALVPLYSLPQWASVPDLEKQIVSLEARLQSTGVGPAGVESTNELMELKRSLDVAQLTPEQYNALQKLTAKIEDFDRSLESIQGLPEELEDMPRHVQAYFFAFCQSFQRTYLAAEVISSGTVSVALTSKFQGTIAAVLNVVGKGLVISDLPFLGCASIIISLCTYPLKRKQKNFLWIFEDFFNGNSRDSYMLAYRCIAKKICVMDNFSDFEVGAGKDTTSIIEKIKTSILEPLKKVVSCHLRKVHLISLEELDPIGLKVIDDLHTIAVGVLHLWEEDHDRYNHLKKADEDEKATFVLECLGVIAKDSCLKYIGEDLQSSKSSKLRLVDISGELVCHGKEAASEPLVGQRDSIPGDAAKVSELEELRAEVRLLASENKRNRRKIRELEKMFPDDDEEAGVGGGGGLQQTLISKKKTNVHAHSLQGSRMDKDERMRVHYLERRVDNMNRQFEEVGFKLFLMERVLSFSEAWQLIENILLRSSDSISGMHNKNRAVRPHEALIPDEKGFFVAGNRKLRIGTVPDSKEMIWKKGNGIKLYDNNHNVKSVRYWFEANGLGYRFQLHCKPVVLQMFSDEIATEYDAFESTFSEPELGVQQDDEKDDENRKTLFDA